MATNLNTLIDLIGDSDADQEALQGALRTAVAAELVNTRETSYALGFEHAKNAAAVAIDKLTPPES